MTNNSERQYIRKNSNGGSQADQLENNSPNHRNPVLTEEQVRAVSIWMHWKYQNAGFLALYLQYCYSSAILTEPVIDQLQLKRDMTRLLMGGLFPYCL